jgi:phytoene desaturase
VTDHARRARGVLLDNGERVVADAVVINADFGHAMSTLFEPGFLRTYTHRNMSKRKYSCSTYMMYLGVNKQYEEPHHNIIFARDYKRNITEIARAERISDDMSIYIRNAGVNDPTLAPSGHSALYVLVPAPNTRSSIVWDDELTESYREKVLDRIAARTTMGDLREHIVEEQIITPLQWASDHYLYNGSTFNLSHSIDQMLYFRPRNRFEECKGCYLVGGGTHPGSGLPTIYESARITADLLSKDIV